MSADAMQSLSGPQLLPVLFGTLPAVQPGMNLDASLFANQLGMIAAPDMSAPAMDVAHPASMAEGVATTLAAPAVPVAPGAAVPLPENASPTEIIDAVLNGGETASPGSAEGEPAESHVPAPRARRSAKPAPVSADGGAQSALAIQAPPVPLTPAATSVLASGSVAPSGGEAGATASMATAPEAVRPSIETAEVPADDAPSIAAESTADILPQAGALTPSVTAAVQATATASVRPSSIAATPRPASVAALPERSAQSLAAMFHTAADEAEPESAAPLRDLPVSGLRAESIQPGWVAALNAVAPMAVSPSGPAAAAPLAAALAPAPQESLAFDAGFVAGIEAQIARLADGGQMVRMQVMPEHLGRIDIELLAGPERDTVRIVTEHDAVRDTLVQSQARLEQDLRGNSQRGADISVELRQSSAGTSGGSPQQQRGQAENGPMPGRDGARGASPGSGRDDTGAASPRRERGNVRYA